MAAAFNQLSMKYRAILSIALAALAIDACVIEAELDPVPQLTERDLVFEAVFEGFPDTKTIVQSNGKSVWWSAHEEISIFYGNSEGSKFTSTNDEPVARAQFRGSLESFTGETESGEPNYFWAIYPYDADSSCDGNSVTTTLPARQAAKSGTFADKQWLTLAKSYGLALSFKNVCSGFYFTVTHPGVIKATFKGNKNEILAGKIKITTDTNGIPVIQEVLSGQKEIILTAPQGETFTVGEKYYFTFLPQTFTQGFTVTLETATEEGIVNINKSVQFKRSDINWRLDLDNGLAYSLKPQPNNEIWYTSTDGNIVNPKIGSLGAEIVSNVYVNGKGIITCSSNITSIGDEAFKGSHTSYPYSALGTLQTIELPSSINSIGQYAFEGQNLTSITIPEGITEIPDKCFWYCTKLTTVSLPEGLEIIGESAFEKCTLLSAINIPNSCTKIDGYAFYDCRQLSISIPEQLEYLGPQAFCRCKIDKNLFIPSKLMFIGVNPFRDCEINSITVDVNNLVYDSRDNCNAIIEKSTAKVITACKNTTLPVGVLEVGERAFNVGGVTSATIPSTIKRINALAFYNDMTDLYCHPFVMPTGGFADGFPSPEYVLHIPKGSSDKYLAWSGDIKEISDRVVVDGGNGLRQLRGKGITAVKVTGAVKWSDISYVYDYDYDDDYTYSSSIREYDFSKATFPAQTYGVLDSAGDPYFSTSAEANVVGAGMFCYGRHIASLVLPDSITKIEPSSLLGVDYLEIPSHVISAVGFSFPYTRDLTIVCDAPNPPILSVGAFSASGRLFVPSSSLDSYENSAWNDHFMIYGR